MPGPKPTPVIERIMRRVVVDANGCWVYQGRCLPSGYGLITANPSDGYSCRTVLTHRVLYEACRGPLGDLHVDHTCENTSCCNPSHLEAVTQPENNLRTRQRGNHANAYGRTSQPREGARVLQEMR